MNSVDVDVIRSAIDWLGRGHRVMLGTVVRTWGSAPRPPGSLMVIRDDGQVAGSLSGGCIEDDLIGRVSRGELAAAPAEATTYGATAEEAQRFGLPCGGTVQVVLEPLSAQSLLRELLAAIESHRVVRRRLDLATGLVPLGDCGGRRHAALRRRDAAAPCTARACACSSSAAASSRATWPAWPSCSTTTSPSASRARSTTRAGQALGA